jgi:hypothetical protein
MQAAQPVLKNTVGRKDPPPGCTPVRTPSVWRSADFFPGVVRIPPTALPAPRSVPVILAA